RELPRALVDELAAHGHHLELSSSSSSRSPHVSRRSVASVRFAGTLPRMRAHVCSRSATAIWYAFGCWSRLQSLTTTSQIGQSSQPATPSNSSPSSTRSGSSGRYQTTHGYALSAGGSTPSPVSATVTNATGRALCSPEQR